LLLQLQQGLPPIERERQKRMMKRRKKREKRRLNRGLEGTDRSPILTRAEEEEEEEEK
jgi:hypothetical protein